MKTKHIPKNELRVIKIGREAIRELVYETIIEHAGDYFDLLSAVDKPCVWRWDEESGDLLFAISEKDPVEIYHLDFDKLNELLPYTTDSMFTPHRRRYRKVIVGEDGEFTVEGEENHA